MKHSSEYTPPAPALTVKFTKPFSTQSRELQAKLDTGADITVIPHLVTGELRLIPAGRISISSFNGREEWRYTYFVNISFLGFELPLVEVISARRRDALLGRNILNLQKAILDGKTLSFELLDP